MDPAVSRGHQYTGSDQQHRCPAVQGADPAARPRCIPWRQWLGAERVLRPRAAAGAAADTATCAQLLVRLTMQLSCSKRRMMIIRSAKCRSAAKSRRSDTELHRVHTCCTSSIEATHSQTTTRTSSCSDIASALPQARPLGTGEALAEYIVDVTTEADRHGDAERFADAYDVAQREHAVGQPLVVEQHGAVKDGRSHIAVSFAFVPNSQHMPALANR